MSNENKSPIEKRPALIKGVKYRNSQVIGSPKHLFVSMHDLKGLTTLAHTHYTQRLL